MNETERALKAARETYQSHLDYCTECRPLDGCQCPRAAQLWRRVCIAQRRAGGPGRSAGNGGRS